MSKKKLTNDNPSDDNYLYSFEDIAHLLKDKSKKNKYKVIEPIYTLQGYNFYYGGYSNLEIKLEQSMKLLKSDKNLQAIAIPVHLSKTDWASIVIKLQNNKYVMLYADSKGKSMDKSLKEDLKDKKLKLIKKEIKIIDLFPKTSIVNLLKKKNTPQQDNKNLTDSGPWVVFNLDSLATTNKLANKKDKDIKEQRQTLKDDYKNNKIEQSGIIKTEEVKNIAPLKILAENNLLYFKKVPRSEYKQYTGDAKKDGEKALSKRNSLKKLEIEYKKLPSKLQKDFVTVLVKKLSEKDSITGYPFKGLVIRSFPILKKGTLSTSDVYSPSSNKLNISAVDKIKVSGSRGEHKIWSIIVHECTHAVDDIYNDFASSKNISRHFVVQYKKDKNIKEEQVKNQMNNVSKIYMKKTFKTLYLDKFLKGNNDRSFIKKVNNKFGQIGENKRLLEDSLKNYEQTIKISNNLQKVKELKDKLIPAQKSILKLYNDMLKGNNCEVKAIKEAFNRQHHYIKTLSKSDIHKIDKKIIQKLEIDNPKIDYKRISSRIKYIDNIMPEFISFHSEMMFEVLKGAKDSKDFQKKYSKLINSFVENHQDLKMAKKSVELIKIANQDFLETMSKACKKFQDKELNKFSEVFDIVLETLDKTLEIPIKKISKDSKKELNFR